MIYSIKTISVFERQTKKLIKKYPSLKSELSAFILILKESPTQGKAIGKSCYKIRLAVKSKGKGKSGGARIITYLLVAQKTVYLLSIYDKSSKDTLTNAELEALLSFAP